VSRLLTERIIIGLAPSGVSTLRLTGARRPRVLESDVVPCEASPIGTAPWLGAVATLTGVATALRGVRAAVTVVVSNQLVRYALVPWSADLARGAEDLAFARHCFNTVHGDRSKSWEIRLSPGGRGATRVASAIDAQLLQAIEANFPESRRSRLVSVQPYLMSAFNRWRRLITQARTWLLLVEPQRACLCCLEGRRWIAIRNVPGQFPEPEQWVSLLDREHHLVGGGANAEVLVHGGHGVPLSRAPIGGWRFTTLGPGRPAGIESGLEPGGETGLEMAFSAA